MACWTGLHGFGGFQGNFYMVGGAGGHVYVLPKTRGDLERYNAADGTFIDSGYIPLDHSIDSSQFVRGAATRDDDPGVIYYTVFDLSPPFGDPHFGDTFLHVATHGGADVTVGTCSPGVGPVFWVPGAGLFGFAFNAPFLTYGDLVKVNVATAATTPVASMQAGGNTNPLVTSDGLAWWFDTEFTGEVKAFDGTTLHSAPPPGSFFPAGIETFDPSHHDVALFSDFVTLERFKLVAGVITDLGPHVCAPDTHGIAQPIWPWDYSAADGWPNFSTMILERLKPPKTGGWRAGLVANSSPGWIVT